MLLAERQIRALISELLLEGVKDDLIAANPGINANDVESLAKSYPKGIAWLNARFGPNRREEETHPIDDAMITIMRFAEQDKAIGDKYAAGKQFTKDVDEAFLTRPRRWSRPNDITSMSIDDITTDEACTFIATAITPWSNQGFVQVNSDGKSAAFVAG